MVFKEVTSEYILFTFPNGHSTDDNPIRLSLNDVRTPRSFRPSSEFKIETWTVEGFIIDAGGTDITVTMSKMNELTKLEIEPLDLTNGAVTDYLVRIDSFVYLKDNDRLMITNPETVGFGPDGITCHPTRPDPLGVSAVSCEKISDTSFEVNVEKLTQQDGIFELIVHGLKNPPNFRKSGLFSDIFMQTDDYYSIQILEKYDNLWIQTNKAAQITDFQRI